MDRINIIDFGSQYTQLIARKVREQKVYCQIIPCHAGTGKIMEGNPSGLILSGGPSSLFDKNAPTIDAEIFSAGIPILGICYGMQLTALLLGGKVQRSREREYGHAILKLARNDSAGWLFSGMPDATQVWMSHGDSVLKAPPGFETIASTDSCRIAAMADKKRRIYGLQFHPEVAHTLNGHKMLSGFLFTVCGCKGDWTMDSIIEQSVQSIQEQAGKAKVVLGLSGGVDSSVAAVLISRALGKQLHCIFVDNGLLRMNERQEVEKVFKKQFRIPLITVDASKIFYAKLKRVQDPERKRKIIGKEFIEVFAGAARKIGKVEYLAQGTIYPDVIESVSFKGPSATIKSHHNVGGLPKNMRNLKLIEPLRELFKDEVRQVGLSLGLPREMVMRHPFPGPGLAVRVLGEVTKERCDILRAADRIFIEEIRNAGWYDRISQALAVLLPVRAVGVMGDERTYQNVLALRAVNTTDFMTAEWTRLPDDLLARVSNRIVNEVKDINRVVYDISTKPPATIEWE
ncbi:MAG: glutamine-hydrolyzing GMP synthase [Candidatus Edwardsbacteria bacterium]|nr:glutamine-hydrolyzing GMP synthase [Candidatus Edwardsbacteria bacterium]MBU1576916.1 glutamine-hydrolyzing GMP synthase [Candidatus Edwardsbacteria bacterium]MBU2463087.1 glutamine-hydrolyzing GMP synthase [Candidatus Edwardsbacteria bacterium]MBU2594277.1 glutamine-hydrolyzing GMP synthase [Candidatus Edwardsbacteria bacterium]